MAAHKEMSKRIYDDCPCCNDYLCDGSCYLDGLELVGGYNDET